ncbi:MAG TPA: peptidylprolyl isomerase [Vicinamibacterales bacterium]|nr:peptidylprolyl isomerase [Vicinamibacterales bacterium]
MRASLIATLIGLVAPIAAAAQTPQQAVLETSAGTIVWDLLADKAPNHVALFIKTAREGGLDGTSFHRMVRYGVVQGGDPVTKDPSARDKYGSGGLNQLKTEITDEKLTKGAVAAVQVPGKPDSAGTQFFMCINAQPSLDGKYTVFARIVEGILVAQKISETPVDANGLATERVIVTKVTIRDKPAETPEPFSTEPVADLARYRAILETSMGEITVSFTPEKAPDHVRNFLRLAQSGVYDGMTFHRVVKGFVIQSGHLPTRKEPLGERQQSYIRPLKAEFNDQIHELGTLSMARTEDPDSATSSFFLVTARAQALDGKYTVFGKVERGIEVVQKIEAVQVNGETPVDRVELVRVRVEKQ